MTGVWLALIACGAVAAIVIAMLVVVARRLGARIDTLTADYAALEAKFNALRENHQQELLAIGERVLAADKIVRRFSERLDGIENNHASDQPQYGQLQNLLKQTASQQGEASAAEKELLALLRRQQRG